MKRIFVVFALFLALIFVVACGGDSKNDRLTDIPDTADSKSDEDEDTADSEPADTESDSGDSDTDDADSGDSQPDGDADTGSTETPEEGIYLGIIGFNDDLTKMPIKRLTDGNKQEFKSFISDLQQLNYTALYWADYSALEMMRDYNPVPEKLKKVAMVTFTDGLDNQSLASDDFNPGFNSQAEYANAIHSMIMDEEGIHGLPVTAYSIGLMGKDVSDVEKFTETLNKLATEEDGDEKFVFQVSDMNEVGQHFADIAASLYSVSTTINVGVYIPGGYDDGQVIRYTFDNVSAAADSALYIEAKYRRSGTSRTLENIKYKGFITGASTISSSATGPNKELYFQFNDLKYSNGDPVSQSEIISKSRLWKQTSSGAWDGETEMNMAELPPIIDEDKSSALIMLVLDSTTSLGSDFAKMQNEAKNFVEILVNGGSGVTESSPCDDNPCATLANSTHICTVSGSSYTCGCNSGYTWNGWQCTSTSTPCNPNPCTSISNSTGVCTVNGTGYTCGCQSGYTWNGGSCTSGGGSSLPECSTSSGTPCYDSTSHLTWSKISSSSMTYTAATTFCQKDSESGGMKGYGGFMDWRLPTISELRTLIQDCPATQMPPSGSDVCSVRSDEGNVCLSSGCWTESACYSCSYDKNGGHSKFGDTTWLWSSSLQSDDSNYAWNVLFYLGNVYGNSIGNYSYVRCVR